MWKVGAIACACLLIAPSLWALQTSTIQVETADTTITLKAGADSPSLLQLSGKDGFIWRNQNPAALIDFVEIGGRRTPVHWALNLAASQIGPSRVELVYDSASPHLRLFWAWRTRAVNGALEHSIRIQNLSAYNLWIPMQDSLQFDWHIPADDALEELWVEKGAGGPSAEGTHRNTISDGYEWTGKSSTYAHPAPGQQREMIPFALVERSDPDRGAGTWESSSADVLESLCDAVAILLM